MSEERTKLDALNCSRPPKDWWEHCEGIDCQCAAFGKCECACGADWTPAETYRIRIAINDLWDAIRDYRDAKGRYHTQIACEHLLTLLPENEES